MLREGASTMDERLALATTLEAEADADWRAASWVMDREISA